MAYKVSIADGDWSNAASWGTGIKTSTDITTATVTVSGSSVFSEVFTAPSLSDSALGCLISISTSSNQDPYTVALQQFNGSTWSDVATATLDLRDVLDAYDPTYTSGTIRTWAFVKFATPYTYTTTSTGYYRYRMVRASGSGSLSLFRSSTSASNFFSFAVDDRTGAPGAGDSAYIVGQGTTTFTITADGTISIGSTSSTTSDTTNGNIRDAIQVGAYGVLKFDDASDVDMTIKGMFRVNLGGILYIGEELAPIPITTNINLTFDNTTLASNFGLITHTGSKFYTYSDIISESLESTVSSGTGTAASPVIFADAVDWEVGDYLVFLPGTDSSTNYNECEYKFIKTKNSATSYVLSDTNGGAEAALTYSHGIAPVLKLNRNINWLNNSTSTSRGCTHTFQCLLAEDMLIQGVGISGCATATLWASTAQGGRVEYSSVHSQQGSSSHLVIGTSAEGSYVKHCMTGKGGTTSFMANISNFTNGLVQDLYIFDSQNAALSFSAANALLEDIKVYAGNRLGSSSFGALYYSSSNVNSKLIGFQTHACRVGLGTNNPARTTFIDAIFGTIAKNQSVHYSNSPNSNVGDIIWINPLFDAGTTDWSLGVTGNQTGSRITVQNYNQDENDHRYEDSFGYVRSTGTGLADTTVRTSGSLAMRLEPRTNVANFKYSLKAVARANSGVSVIGYAKKNATLQNYDVTINLYLPGSSSPDNSFTLANSTDWQLWSVVGNYAGTVDRYAIVEFVITSPGSSGGYLYVDDIFNGTNVITSLDLWDNGEPSPVMFEQLGDPAAVWAVSNTNIADGTMGAYLRYIDRKVDDAQVLGLVR